MNFKKRFLAGILALAVAFSGVFVVAPIRTEAAGGYSIRVNRNTNVATVYNSNGQAVKAMLTSCGGGNTTLGTFKTSAAGRWYELDGPCWGQYCTRINGGVLFHSVWYYVNGDNSSQATKQFNKLGSTASHGCVRLSTADAKWVWDNCRNGTTVTIFAGSAADDPLGKPEQIMTVSTASSRGWDPTDPDLRNPYHYATPVINGLNLQQKREYKSVYDPFAGVSATLLGGDITKYMSVELRKAGNSNYKKCNGSFKLSRMGTYRVRYTVASPINGWRISHTVKIKVVDTKKPKLSGVKNGTGTYARKVNLVKGVKAKLVSGKNITKKIQVYVKKPGSSSYKKYSYNTAKNYKPTKSGKYKIKYVAINPTSKKKTTKTVKFDIYDRETPILKVTATNYERNVNTSLNLLSGVSARYKSVDKSLYSKINVYVLEPGSSTYVLITQQAAKNYVLSKPGTYSVKLEIRNPNQTSKVATAYKTIKVNELVTANVDTSLQTTYNLATESVSASAVNLTNYVTATCASFATPVYSYTIQKAGGSAETLTPVQAATYDFTSAANGPGSYTLTVTCSANSVSVTKTVVFTIL